MKIPRVLTIAGSDSSGGAGIQADLKTIAYHGCFGMSAITAITVQNTEGVIAIEPVSVSVIQQQIQAIAGDIGVDAIKIGMLLSLEAIEVVAEELGKIGKVPVVLDPVMASTTGARLIDDKAVACLIEKLFPLSLIITPNLVEAQTLARVTVNSDADIKRAGEILLEFGPNSVLIKGGHRDNQTANDCLVSNGGILWFRQNVIDSRNTHGTGCTLSTAIACFLAKGYSFPNAVRAAKAFVTECLYTFKSASLGHGYGAVFPTYRGSP